MERLQFIRKAAKALLLLALPLGGVGGGVLFTACTDTWDDHYNSIGDSSGMHEGTLWQAIKSDPNLSNFASVVEACDIAKDLNGSQVFTVFAPTNNSFSQAEAQALIADYRQQVRDSVVEEDNTVIKEFIHNHIAPYNHSVASSSNDSIILMNGKYAVLKNNDIDGVPLLTKNQLYSNGVLYTLSSQRDYLSNVFEYIRKDPDLDSLRSFAKNFGHTLGDTSNPKTAAGALNELMKEAKGKPEENALQLLALRSMARARYSTDNVGHYGLAFQYYTHFTSPIRRYPDMMVHRLLAMYMDGATSQDKLYYEDCCEHSSVREQIATDAERASIKYKMVEYMQDKIGRLFEGHVSGLTEWGIYVEVEPTKIEGMVALRDVHFDWFEFDEEKYETRGKSSGRVFHLGDPVKVRVLRANLEQKILDYELVEE